MATDAGQVRQLDDQPDLVHIQPGRRLGWFRPASQRKCRPRPVEHLGGGARFFNLIRIYPPSGGVAVMGNATNYNINAVASPTLSRT